MVFELDQVTKHYDELELFNKLDMRIERGEKIAIVGPNGCGKSTLARILAGEEPLTSGTLKLGHQVSVGFFAQQQADALDVNKDVYSNLEAASTNREVRHLRTILGAFLFQGDDVYKLVKVLSGGEKSRLALARILCRPNNCLILDEPTNHIDMKTKAILQQALLDYKGTCLIVSHDRAFLDPIVTRVIELTHNRVRNFIGNVSEYLLKIEEEEQEQGTVKMTDARSTASPASSKERRRKRAAMQRKIAPMKKEFAELEAKITARESKKEFLEAQLCDAAFFKQGDKAQAAVLEHRKAEDSLKRAYEDWEELGKKISEFESKLA